MTRTSLPLLTIRGRHCCPSFRAAWASAFRRTGWPVRWRGRVPWGTIASVDLRRLHPDLMKRLRKCNDPVMHGAANVEALDREVRAARNIAGPDGFIAVNVMRALSNYAESVVQACKSGANAIIAGAGLPFDLPALTEKSRTSR